MYGIKGKNSCAGARCEGEWGSRIMTPLFFISALAGGDWSTSRSGCFTQGKYLINKTVHKCRTVKNAAFFTESGPLDSKCNKSKVVPVHMMKGGSRGIAPLIPNLYTR